jgi:hypothetical protein
LAESCSSIRRENREASGRLLQTPGLRLSVLQNSDADPSDTSLATHSRSSCLQSGALRSRSPEAARLQTDDVF